MKTNRLFLLTSLLFFGAVTISIAQVTEPTNAVSNSNSYVGTSNNNDVLFKRQNVNAGSLTTTNTTFGLNSFALGGSLSIGNGAGQFSTANFTSNAGNTFVGTDAGAGNSATSISNGSQNSFFGAYAGQGSNGELNTYIGLAAGNNSSSSQSTFLGYGAGWQSTGINNILVGVTTGMNLTGSNNLILGNSYDPSSYAYESKLVIENGYDFYAPLIWGDFEVNQLKLNAKVGIGFEFGNYPTMAGGVDVSGYNLFVKGGILTEAVRVNLESNWADYVFNKDYALKSISEVEKFINDNGHLPNVPSAAQVKEEGIELGEMAKIQQEKIEELTLYIIDLNKRLEAQDKKIELLMQTKQ